MTTNDTPTPKVLEDQTEPAGDVVERLIVDLSDRLILRMDIAEDDPRLAMIMDEHRAAIATLTPSTPVASGKVVPLAIALLDRLYRSHLPSDAALPHASEEWKDARRKADALREALLDSKIGSLTPTPDDVGKIVAWMRDQHHVRQPFLMGPREWAARIERGDWRLTPSVPRLPDARQPDAISHGLEAPSALADRVGTSAAPSDPRLDEFEIDEPGRGKPGPSNEGWRDIESAPKDGTFIDVWRLAPNKVHGKRLPDVRWDNNRSFNGGIGRVALPDSWVYSHGGEVWLDGGSLTHWRPRPADPRSPEGSAVHD